ncbi:MAG: hypothetical protein Q8O93_00405 [bacterium]|nr:hypothetical protein [bacterium]
MAGIDERLLAARQRNQERQEEDSRADRLRQARMADEDKGRQEEAAGADRQKQSAAEPRSLRQRAMQARQALNLKERAKQKLEAKVTAPAKIATSNALRWAWLTLIPSFGLSLIYINIHVFLRMVLGEKLFCKLGEEWIPKQVSAIGGEAGKGLGKSIGIVEVMGLVFLDLMAFFIILAVLGLLVMIATWLGASWWGKLGMIYDALKSMGWATIKALVSLFS